MADITRGKLAIEHFNGADNGVVRLDYNSQTPSSCTILDKDNNPTTGTIPHAGTFEVSEDISVGGSTVNSIKKDDTIKIALRKLAKSIPNSSTDTLEVKVSETDGVAGFLEDKLVDGINTTITKETHEDGSEQLHVDVITDDLDYNAWRGNFKYAGVYGNEITYTKDSEENGLITIHESLVTIYENTSAAPEFDDYDVSDKTQINNPILVTVPERQLQLGFNANGVIFVALNGEGVASYNYAAWDTYAYGRMAFITAIPVLRIWWQENDIHIAPMDLLSEALTEKIANRITDTNYYARKNNRGLQLSITGDLHYNITSATVYAGVVPIDVLEFSSSLDTSRLMYSLSNSYIFQQSQQTLNNTQYNNPTTGLVTLSSINKYTVNYVYRTIGDIKECYIVLGSSEYNNVAEAQASSIPNVNNEMLNNHAILLGRFIVKKGATTGIWESSLDTTFKTTTVTEHSDLAGLNDNTDYLHVTQAEKDAWNAGGGDYYYETTLIDITYPYHDGSMIPAVSDTTYIGTLFIPPHDIKLTTSSKIGSYFNVASGETVALRMCIHERGTGNLVAKWVSYDFVDWTTPTFFDKLINFQSGTTYTLLAGEEYVIGFEYDRGLNIGGLYSLVHNLYSGWMTKALGYGESISGGSSDFATLNINFDLATDFTKRSYFKIIPNP